MPGHDLLTAPASAPAQEGSAPGSASDPTERASTIRDAFDAKVEQEFAEHSPGDIEYRAWEIADDVTAALLTEKTAHLRNRVWARAYNAALRALCHLLDDRDEVELRRQQVTKLVNEFRGHWIAEGNPDMSYAEIY